jgi:hypothetical protein
MVFTFIQAIQLRKGPRNLKNIRVSYHVCIADADAVAVADETAAAPFRSRIKISDR